jgi:hypothetical protein
MKGGEEGREGAILVSNLSNGLKCTRIDFLSYLDNKIVVCVFPSAPGRALILVFNNPSATEGYLSWGYLSKKLEFFTPYQYI